MATQRPPWFRLPTMRPPAPSPAPAPPRPPAIVRPAIPIRPPPQPQEPAPASQPPAPPKPTSPVATPPTSPVAPPAPRPSPPRASPPPSSPVTKAASVPTSSPQPKTQTSNATATPPLPTAETTNVKKATPLSSHKPSQEIKPSSHPPSPLQLPPAQIRPSSEEEEREPKIEQKSVLVQEKPNNAHSLHGVPSKGKKEPPTKDKGTIKKLSDSEDLGMRVITIAGENRGALMEITSSNKNKHPHGSAYTLANTRNDTAGDGKSDDKEKNLAAQSQPSLATFLNSNVQGVNNSIVFNSSCHHNDPGIHLSLVRKLNASSRANHHA